MKTYQIVIPPSAPELPCVHKFTRDATTLGKAPIHAVILVTTMSDEDFNALAEDKIFA